MDSRSNPGAPGGPEAARPAGRTGRISMLPTTRMRAIRFHAFGGPEMLVMDDVEVPVPGPDEVLIRVRAAGVNPVDWKTRAGRLGDGTRLPMIPGRDVAGEVVAVGPAGDAARIGAHVYGVCASGSYAEYAIARLDTLAPKPRTLDDEHAAGVPVAGLTAWQALFDHGKLTSGERVLVHGACGGVGSFAVQFAKWKGARVVGTGRADHLAQIRALGADEVVDEATPLERALHDVDLVIDVIGGEVQRRSFEVLKPGGRLISTVEPPPLDVAAERHVRADFFVMQASSGQLAEIARLIDLGRVQVLLHEVLPLARAPKAHELSQTGHLCGKLVLQID